MTHKSKIFSAFAVAAAGTLMITTTAYQSKAASGIIGNSYHVDEGTGYAGGEVTAVASLNTTSSGTFHYDAPGTNDDIKIEGKDITDIETAVKALSRQITGLGDTAKAADIALDTSTATAITNASTVNSASLADIKASIDALSETNSSSASGIYGKVVKTKWGCCNKDRCFLITGNAFYNAGLVNYLASFGSSGAVSGIDNTGVFGYVIWDTGKNRSEIVNNNLSAQDLAVREPSGIYAGSRLKANGSSAYYIDSTGNLRSISDGSNEYVFAPLV